MALASCEPGGLVVQTHHLSELSAQFASNSKECVHVVAVLPLPRERTPSEDLKLQM